MDAKVAELLDALMRAAQQIGAEGIRLWPQMVGITWLKGVASLVGGPLLALLFAGVAAASARVAANADSGEWAEIPGVMGAVLAGAAALTVTIIVLVTLGDSLAAVFYPEAQTVLNLAKSIK